MCMEGLNARVAQSVERSAVNRKVGGSNPPVSDIFVKLTYIIIFYEKKGQSQRVLTNKFRLLSPPFDLRIAQTGREGYNALKDPHANYYFVSQAAR